MHSLSSWKWSLAKTLNFDLHEKKKQTTTSCTALCKANFLLNHMVF